MKKKTPYRYIPFISELYRNTLKLFKAIKYRGSLVKCPVCLKTFRSWIADPEAGGCPSCGSQARHRLLWLFLENCTSTFDKKHIKILHFAPEECLQTRFRDFSQIKYTTADLSAPNVDVTTNLTNLIFQDQSFDVIICSHVLEHIPDDKTAMMELYRVLVSEGVAYIQVPYRRDHETDEDPNITDPKEREKRWGQFDHVRLYGKDLKLRLESVGFLVKENDYAQKLDEESCKKYGLWDDVIFQCTKP